MKVVEEVDKKKAALLSRQRIKLDEIRGRGMVEKRQAKSEEKKKRKKVETVK